MGVHQDSKGIRHSAPTSITEGVNLALTNRKAGKNGSTQKSSLVTVVFHKFLIPRPGQELFFALVSEAVCSLNE